LKDDAPKADVAPVTAFETGTNTWRACRLAAGAPAAAPSATPLYLTAGLKAELSAPRLRG
jgi:uncharacterized protein